MLSYVDVQGFKVQNKFVIKEFALLDDHGNCFHFIFAPPFDYENLSLKDKKNYRYSRAYHGLSWFNHGTIPYKTALPIISSILQNYNTHYVKGFEKVRWLSDYTRNSIINIEMLGINYKTSKANDSKFVQSCGNHYGVCAKRNCNLISFIRNFI